jgi:demethylmenaquinone methyltransferase/2-methoxy-6-polyprenyl-1,4-benzoquinol methylase
VEKWKKSNHFSTNRDPSPDLCTAPSPDLCTAPDLSNTVAFLVGDMTRLPVPSGSFDVVTTGYGLRNVPDLRTAIAEIHRVLAPGGAICSLDFDRPEGSLKRAVFLAHLTMVGSSLGWILHRDPDTYRYIPASIRRYPGARGVADLLRAAGFTEVKALPVFGGFMAIHVGRKGRVEA